MIGGKSSVSLEKVGKVRGIVPHFTACLPSLSRFITRLGDWPIQEQRTRQCRDSNLGGHDGGLGRR